MTSLPLSSHPANRIHVALPQNPYDIIIGNLNTSLAQISTLFQVDNKAFILTDSNIENLYAQSFKQQIGQSGFENFLYSFPAGETHKTLDTIGQICTQAVKCGLDRHDFFIALGGGVTGDMTGFAAAIYMRGVDFVQVPTTLLAMVDSSVGGKTGVDLPLGKNLIGAFHQPKLVIIDPQFLKTLPLRQLRCGLAEVVKYAIILDRDFFDYLSTHVSELLTLNLDCYAEVIARCCQIKSDVVIEDECEKGIRALLNFGHTFGHAVELLSDFRIEHGEGVAIGMKMAGDLAVDLKLWNAEDNSQMTELLQKLNLLTALPDTITPEAIVQAMYHDKKTQKGQLNLILPRAVGQAEVVKNVPPQTIINTLRHTLC